MFQISDVMVDKDEVAMALHIKIDLPDYKDPAADPMSVSKPISGVSESTIASILQKVGKVLSAQGFPCFACRKMQYKLLPLSPDCREVRLDAGGIMEYQGILVLSCADDEVFRFEIGLLPEEV